MTQSEAANAWIEMQRKAAAEKLPYLQQASDAARNPDDKRAAAKQTNEAVANLGAFNSYALQIKQSLQGAFEGMFTGLLNGTKSLKDSFKSLFENIASSFASMVAKMASEKLMQLLMGSGSSGLGGIVNSFASSGGASDALSGIGSWLGGLLSFDVGTDYVPNDMVAMIHKGEKIVPAAYNNPKSQGAGNVVQHLNFNFDQPQSSQTMMQLASATGMSMQRAMQRNL
jgi:hypothetical protein